MSTLKQILNEKCPNCKEKGFKQGMPGLENCKACGKLWKTPEEQDLYKSLMIYRTKEELALMVVKCTLSDVNLDGPSEERICTQRTEDCKGECGWCRDGL